MRRLGTHRAQGRGFTLLEVMVAIGIVAMLGVLLYGAFMGMSRSRKNMEQVADRYQQGRQALDRMGRELSSAFLSAHQPFQQLQFVRQTIFIGGDSRPADRVDFTAFAHRRLRADTHESDQCEISYFASTNPDTGALDLVRREDKFIDDDPQRGGVVQVLAEDIDSFDVKYLDPLTNQWLDSWDSVQAAAQVGRLPAAVWLTVWLNGGPGGGPVKFETKIPIPIQMPLSFATAPN